ncbi:hypothetical protein UA08_08967 [Talaromyces atroroseus]|uniref:FAD/NAD(P)-binding domain-containing protein n=1 Tax=Talaromyces atroroseus TaxID=1441469 RepID=A0A1Q5Q7L1_TALAT|nr:hypothetical protein UA08_08967 [Talaromyces atroroseus]OKL55661.1 hypothetical protein UA08_08967 [Talaromyces atroroseus]
MPSPKTPLDTLPCSLPTREIPPGIDPASICQQAFDNKNIAKLCETDFIKHAIWRDMFSLSSTLRTFYSASAIVSIWRSLSRERGATAFEVKPGTASVKRQGLASGPQVSWIEVSFTFSMAQPLEASCLGYLCLVFDDSDEKWKIWIMGTILDQLPDFADVDRLDPVESSARLDNVHGNRSLSDNSHQQHDYGCVIIGGGQAGLCTAGRLQALGVSYICVDSNDRIGDSWRKRYDSSKLHTIRESSHLPFERTFTPDYPQWLSKDDIADAFQAWSKKYGLTPHIWLSTTLESGSWNEVTSKWTLHLQRKYHSDSGVQRSEFITVMSSHVVLAIGVNCHVPLRPDYANKSEFQGHDIAEDMLDAGLASVTVVQRSKTFVMPQENYMHWAETQYNTDTDMKICDIKCFGYPYAVNRNLGLLASQLRQKYQPDLYSDLKKAGFLLEEHDDITRHLCERLGGHYMDVGASKKIADGLIKMKTGCLPTSYTKTGLKFDDNTHLDADVIIFATGFLANMGDIVRKLFGDQVANRAGDCWGVDSEGEIKGAFKPTGQPGLWYMAGGINHARFFSRFVALHIKAALEGRPMPVFDAKQSSISPRL